MSLAGLQSATGTSCVYGTWGQNLEWLRSGRIDLVGTGSEAGCRAHTDRDLLDVLPGDLQGVRQAGLWTRYPPIPSKMSERKLLGFFCFFLWESPWYACSSRWSLGP